MYLKIFICMMRYHQHEQQMISLSTSYPLNDVDIIQAKDNRAPTNFPQSGKSNAVSYDQLKRSLTAYLKLAGRSMTGFLDMGDKVIYNTQLDNTPLSNDSWIENINFVKQKFVIKSGATMTGNLDRCVNKITSNAFPIASSDLTNKNYVDDMFAGYTAMRVAK
ncbi:hypothetical protein CHS0354_002238 [Potamilus streckersoni]|uniref:Uncharacterized protein n=1 Tax=Potamilus streckersoni TaxID=2493646 RepID=A0AAE0WAB7_9BIVA|nr:hypothetical protein CHS0354_002238 [Potamilus streckersoni]